MVEALFTPSISQQYSVCFFISGRSHADIYKFKNHKKKNGVMLYEKKGARWQTSQPVAGGALDMSVCILLDPQEQGTSQYPPKNQLSWPCSSFEFRKFLSGHHYLVPSETQTDTSHLLFPWLLDHLTLTHLDWLLCTIVGGHISIFACDCMSRLWLSCKWIVWINKMIWIWSIWTVSIGTILASVYSLSCTLYSTE